jgi:CheY-like chemotaxis protein
MERQLQHMVRLVDDLLDISRISQGKLTLRKERITLTAAVQHALELCKQAVREQGHELIVSLPQEDLFIEADKTRIAQAICNLLNNAAKYSERGKSIWITAGREEDHAVIRVKDEGIGIGPQLLPHIFEMFVQADRSLERSQGGLGVGLAIVKRVVEMHNGSVEAFSMGPGEGSEFTIRLPLVAATASALSGNGNGTSEKSTAVRRRILVVDDNIDGAHSLSLILSMMGHDVRTANDGETGFEQAAAFRPDVIFLDLGMPKQNGFEVAQAIRAQSWGQSMRLVALTGWGQEEDRRKSKEAGFNHHLVKPVDPAALERLL